MWAWTTHRSHQQRRLPPLRTMSQPYWIWRQLSPLALYISMESILIRSFPYVQNAKKWSTSEKRGLQIEKTLIKFSSTSFKTKNDEKMMVLASIIEQNSTEGNHKRLKVF